MSDAILLICANHVPMKVYSRMETVVLVLLFAWLISTAIMTVRSSTDQRMRDTVLHARRFTTVTAPMRALSTSETGERVQ